MIWVYAGTSKIESILQKKTDGSKNDLEIGKSNLLSNTAICSVSSLQLLLEAETFKPDLFQESKHTMN